METITVKPVEKFLQGLDPVLWGQVNRYRDILTEEGKNLHMPYSKKISKNLYELRILGVINVRVFYTFKSDKIILLHGFIKTTHKIPSRHMTLGMKRLKALTGYKL